MLAELTLTRVFSVLIWYHLAFFAISVALLGSSFGALIAHLGRARWAAVDASTSAAWAALAMGAALAVLEVVLVQVVPMAGMNLFASLSMPLVLFFLVTALPFVCGGFALTRWISERTGSMRWLYLGDLTGAALAACTLPLWLAWMGGPRTLAFAAVPAAIAAVLGFASRGRRALAVLACLLFAGWSTAGDGSSFDIRAAKGAPIPPQLVEFNRWNSFSMVTVMRGIPFVGWGRSPRSALAPSDQRAIFIDLNAMTPITRFDGRLEPLADLHFDLTSAAHSVAPGRREVCVIGAGGGRDVLSALRAGARHVTAVEINPLIANDAMRGTFCAFSGGLYDRRDVDVVVEDGRSYVRRTARRFDLLQLSMVDTSAATAAGAYALTENSLYTTDAFVDDLAVLRAGGVLTVGSASLEGLATGARLVSTARAALRQVGRDPARALIVLSTPWLGNRSAELYNVLIKPDGWSADEVERAARWSASLGFQSVYLPGQTAPDPSPEHGWIRAMIETPGVELPPAVRELPMDLSATTDDRPFFFYQNRIRDLGRVLFSSLPAHFFGNGLAFIVRLGVLTLAAMGIFLAAAWIGGREVDERRRISRRADATYVFLLGVGFMMIEMPMLQRFSMLLGNPTASLSVVLSTLLVCGGVGSATLNRERVDEAGHLRRVIAGLVVYGAILTFSFDLWAHLLRAQPSAVRVMASAALLAPLGFLCGGPLSIAIRHAGRRDDARVPWLWGMNGAASVFGSVAATAIALHAGLRAATLCGLLAYVAAMALAGRVASPSTGPMA